MEVDAACCACVTKVRSEGLKALCNEGWRQSVGRSAFLLRQAPMKEVTNATQGAIAKKIHVLYE